MNPWTTIAIGFVCLTLAWVAHVLRSIQIEDPAPDDVGETDLEAALQQSHTEFGPDEIEWIEYEFGGRTYCIERPRGLSAAGRQDIIEDDTGLLHMLPAPGVDGCVARMRPRFDAGV